MPRDFGHWLLERAIVYGLFAVAVVTIAVLTAGSIWLWRVIVHATLDSIGLVVAIVVLAFVGAGGLTLVVGRIAHSEPGRAVDPSSRARRGRPEPPHPAGRASLLQRRRSSP